jgi:HlyD family secretion protein
MTATVDITKTKKNILAVPISSVVVKSDTASTKDIKMVLKMRKSSLKKR